MAACRRFRSAPDSHRGPTRASCRSMTTPSREWRETIPEGEDALFEKIGRELAEIARERDGGVAKHRALHPKQHLGARATLTIEDGLPPHARHGLFAAPGSYRAYVRFSNGAGRFQHDREPDLRGLAVKVLGVEGKKVLGEHPTQDFLFVDAPSLPFRSVDEFVGLVRAGKDPKRLPQRLIGELGFFGALGLIGRVVRSVKGKRGTLVDLPYYTAAPIAVGPYAARLALEPLHDRDGAARAGSEASYLRADAEARHGKHALRWALSAQYFTSEAETPIERGDVAWPSPLEKLGTLRLETASGDPGQRARLDAFVETLSFDPWHALEAHRPLGNVMRARKHAYYASTQGRKAAPEPSGDEWAGFA